jgi:hypothetical protein
MSPRLFRLRPLPVRMWRGRSVTTEETTALGGLPPGAVPAKSVTTPSCIEIVYYTKPKRAYYVRAPFVDGVTPVESEGFYEVPSVTTVLEVLDKPALPWWGMTMGVSAINELLRMGVLVPAQTFGGETVGLARPGGHVLDVSELVEVVKEFKLTTNHVKDKAGDRGLSAHSAFEAWGAIGRLPSPDDHPWEEKGYITGLLAFLIEAENAGMEMEMQEVIVASAEHGFAGRFDMVATIERDMRVVTKTYPKNPSKYTTVPATSRILIDVKTSKSVYTSHFLQLAAYNLSLKECGYGSTDSQAVLHIEADGRYEFRQSKGVPEDFIAILGAYHAHKRTEGMLKIK